MLVTMRPTPILTGKAHDRGTAEARAFAQRIASGWRPANSLTEHAGEKGIGDREAATCRRQILRLSWNPGSSSRVEVTPRQQGSRGAAGPALRQKGSRGEIDARNLLNFYYPTLQSAGPTLFLEGLDGCDRLGLARAT